MRRVKREGEQRKTANIWWDPRTWDCVEQLETVRKSSAAMLASARAEPESRQLRCPLDKGIIIQSLRKKECTKALQYYNVKRSVEDTILDFTL